MNEARTLCTAVAVVFAVAVFAFLFAVGSVVASDASPQSGMSDASVSTSETTVPSVLERTTGALLGQVNETDTPADDEQTEEDQQTTTEQAQTEAETESEETETPTESEQTEGSTESEETETPTESEATEEPTENEETEEPTQTENPTDGAETETPTQADEPTDDGETETPTQADEPTDDGETEEPAEGEGTESGTQAETEADDGDDSEGDTDATRDDSEDSDDSDPDGGSDDSDDSDDSNDSQSDGEIYDGITESDGNESGTSTDEGNLTAQNGTAGGGAPPANTTDQENGTAGFVTETGTDETATPAGQETADLRIRDASLSADWVRSGFNTTVRTTVQNARSRPVNETLTVTVDGEPVATNEVALDPAEETVVETEFEAVDGTVRVNGVTAGQLTVENQSAPATVGDEQATTAARGPGFSLAQVGVVVTILTAIGWTSRSLRRQRDR